MCFSFTLLCRGLGLFQKPDDCFFKYDFSYLFLFGNTLHNSLAIPRNAMRWTEPELPLTMTGHVFFNKKKNEREKQRKKEKKKIFTTQIRKDESRQKYVSICDRRRVYLCGYVGRVPRCSSISYLTGFVPHCQFSAVRHQTLKEQDGFLD